MAQEPGLRVVCVREVQRSIADSVKQLLEDKIAEYGLDGFFKTTDAEISGLNGSRCVFRGMQNHTAASIKSLEGFDLAWIEEAQTISQKSLDLLTPTIRKPGSQIWASWNPENEDDPVDVFFAANEGEDFLLEHVNYDRNPWFPDELRKDMERDRTRDPDKFAHVWEGQYRGLSEARVFRNWREGVIDVPPNVIWFHGADWGFANDETAAVRCCVPDWDKAHKDGTVPTLYVDAEVFELGVPTDALPKFLNGLPEARDWVMTADSARPETIDYVKRHGIPKIRPARKGKGSVEDGISFLQGFDIVINPRCANTIREFRRYAYKTDPRTGEILPAIEDKDNHCIDALRYAVEGLHRKGKMLPTMLDKPRKRDRYDEPEVADADWKIL
jgi:phage terminase large subunit